MLGGSLGEVFAEKICKVMDLALRTGSPMIGINDSGGARIQEGVVSLGGYAEIFWRNVQSSGVIPQISLIAGPCAGGAVYSPAITDFTIMVEGISQMFITGPEIIKAVTGEDVTFEELGGAMTHATKSGVNDLVAADEDEMNEQTRRLLSFIPQNNVDDPPPVASDDDPERLIPELDALIPDSPNKPYDILDAIVPVVDDEDFRTAAAVRTQPGHRLRASAGAASASCEPAEGARRRARHDASRKSARSCALRCVQHPMLTFVDVPGFLPGTTPPGGIIKHSAKLLYAFAEATVPKITVVAQGLAPTTTCRQAHSGGYQHGVADRRDRRYGLIGAVRTIFRREMRAPPIPRQRSGVDRSTARFANRTSRPSAATSTT